MISNINFTLISRVTINCLSSASLFLNYSHLSTFFKAVHCILLITSYCVQRYWFWLKWWGFGGKQRGFYWTLPDSHQINIQWLRNIDSPLKRLNIETELDPCVIFTLAYTRTQYWPWLVTIFKYNSSNKQFKWNKKENCHPLSTLLKYNGIQKVFWINFPPFSIGNPQFASCLETALSPNYNSGISQPSRIG